MTLRSLRLSLLALAGTLLPTVARAQQPASTPAAATPTVVTPALDFSGVVFGNYNYRMDSASKATLGGKSPNAFTLDRAYLTFRMPAGQNGAIRVTTDVFQNTNNANNGFYQGWLVRIKYGYGQYTGLRNALGTGSSLTGRVGILHTVVIDHEEGFWPRYLSQVALERNNFFSSADAGLAGLLTLGNSWGEIYGTLTNGPGYTSFDKDRFKDIALRASLTPLASHEKLNPILRSFSITPWFYKGWVGSQFQSGGPGQIGPGENGAITEGLRRDRFGLFTGIRDRRVIAAAEYAQRQDQSETGANTAANPAITHDSTGRLFDGFIIARPLEWLDSARHSPLSVVARFDHFTPTTDPSSPAYAGTTPSYNYWLIGGSYDITSRFVLTLDWQVQSPTGFPPPTGTNVRATPRSSTLFLNWQATF